jgi:hypothetical protein
MKEPKYLIIACSAICLIAAIVFINARMFRNDIKIGVSEDNDELTLSATFPDSDSEMVQDYIKSELRMTDLSDLHAVEIKHYETPNRKMRFYIKSKDGYIKIVLKRDENSSAAYYKLKRTSKGLEEVLTGH